MTRSETPPTPGAAKFLETPAAWGLDSGLFTGCEVKERWRFLLILRRGGFSWPI